MSGREPTDPRDDLVRYVQKLLIAVAVGADALETILVNLLDNALHHAGPAPTVTIGLSRDGGTAVLTVADNGPGIDPESQSKLFEPYFTTKSKGTGLGLTNTQNIILNHNGHIALESEKGKGAAFTITLDFA